MSKYIKCRICGKSVEESAARAGYQDAKGNLVLICDSHFGSFYDLINGWSNFVVSEDARD